MTQYVVITYRQVCEGYTCGIKGQSQLMLSIRAQFYI